MWRRAEAMRRALSAFCSVVLLAGCVTAPVSHEPLIAPAQEELLRGLGNFRLDGRASVQAGDEAFNPSLSWRQKGPESQLKLSGPLGAGSMALSYSPQSLRVTTSRGEKLENAEAERALAAQLGFLRLSERCATGCWVLRHRVNRRQGRRVMQPGASPKSRSRDGRIQYDRWTDVATSAGVVKLPQRLTATRASLRLRLFVDRWKLQASD